MLKTLPRIQSMWTYKNKTPADTLLALAEFVHRKASIYADHGLIGLKNPIKRKEGEAPFIGIEDKEFLQAMKVNPNDPKKEDRVWEYYFNGFIECFSQDSRVKGRQEIYDKVVEIERFTGVPEKIFKLRKTHGREFEKIARRLTGQNQNPEQNLLSEVRRIINRPRSEYHNIGILTLARARALDICVAASIYADVRERTQQKNWTDAYAEGMELIYPEVNKHADINEAIVTMD